MPARCLLPGRHAWMLLAILIAATGAAQPDLPLSRLTLVEQLVELGSETGGWRAARESESLPSGAGLRTGEDGLARIELLWMSLTLSPASTLSLPDNFIMSVELMRGRLRIDSAERDMLTLVTAEAEVRGTGEAVVRRTEGLTLVSCLSGRLLVDAGGRTVTLQPGEGTVVRSGLLPTSPEILPGAPQDTWPAEDCAYVAAGRVLELAGQATAVAHHLEILAVGNDAVLLGRDVGQAPWRIAIPWPGAFRWRVAARNERGLEGAPSREGLICVDE